MYYQDVKKLSKASTQIDISPHQPQRLLKDACQPGCSGVVSASMAAVLRSFGPPEAEGTAKFCKMVDGFFNCLNFRPPKEKKPFLASHHDSQDGKYNNGN